MQISPLRRGRTGLWGNSPSEDISHASSRQCKIRISPGSNICVSICDWRAPTLVSLLWAGWRCCFCFRSIFSQKNPASRVSRHCIRSPTVLLTGHYDHRSPSYRPQCDNTRSISPLARAPTGRPFWCLRSILVVGPVPVVDIHDVEMVVVPVTLLFGHSHNNPPGDSGRGPGSMAPGCFGPSGDTRRKTRRQWGVR
jgi:hypothetical protein